MYVTVYKKVKKAGAWDWSTYQTKSLTEHHAFLREGHGWKTYKDPTVVITHVIGGFYPLEKPIVNGEQIC